MQKGRKWSKIACAPRKPLHVVPDSSMEITWVRTLCVAIALSLSSSGAQTQQRHFHFTYISRERNDAVTDAANSPAILACP